MKILATLILCLTALVSAPSPVFAQDDTAFDAYDPFADYSEFDQASEEEADINFFRNGRFFTLGFIGGYRSFTSILGEIYSGAPAFGGYISYFFDLRFAIQLSFITGDHGINISTPSGTIRGSSSVRELGFGVKYFLNTQNVTRGLAPINPYILVSMVQVARTQKFDGAIGQAYDATLGFAGSFGIEIPMMRNKMYFGAEATYQYISFPDENNEIVVNNVQTGIFPRGDFVRFNGIIGVNF